MPVYSYMLNEAAWLIVYLPILFFSVIVHEVAHGLAAERCGDPTARLMGRITFNPIPHIDLVGTILIPLVLILSGSRFFFAWAKPVPVNYFNFKNPRRDLVLTSFAGPAANIGLGLISIILIKLIMLISYSPLLEPILFILKGLTLVNFILATFNLLPIPPLDGSKILLGFLPYRLAIQYERLERFGIIILFILIFSGIISRIMNLVYNIILMLL